VSRHVITSVNEVQNEGNSTSENLRVVVDLGLLFRAMSTHKGSLTREDLGFIYKCKGFGTPSRFIKQTAMRELSHRVLNIIWTKQYAS
jgi:hypothetical protein